MGLVTGFNLNEASYQPQQHAPQPHPQAFQRRHPPNVATTTANPTASGSAQPTSSARQKAQDHLRRSVLKKHITSASLQEQQTALVGVVHMRKRGSPTEAAHERVMGYASVYLEAWSGGNSVVLEDSLQPGQPKLPIRKTSASAYKRVCRQLTMPTLFTDFYKGLYVLSCTTISGRVIEAACWTTIEARLSDFYVLVCGQSLLFGATLSHPTIF